MFLLIVQYWFSYKANFNQEKKKKDRASEQSPRAFVCFLTLKYVEKKVFQKLTGEWLVVPSTHKFSFCQDVSVTTRLVEELGQCRIEVGFCPTSVVGLPAVITLLLAHPYARQALTHNTRLCISILSYFLEKMGTFSSFIPYFETNWSHEGHSTRHWYTRHGEQQKPMVFSY